MSPGMAALSSFATCITAVERLEGMIGEYLVVNESRFPHETIDGETILFDAETGHIILMSGFAAVIWTFFLRAAESRELTNAVEARFGVQAAVETERFVAELRAAQLLAESNEAVEVDLALLPWPREFSKPVFERFDDIAKIIAMDPIHDVDAAGWPRPAKP